MAVHAFLPTGDGLLSHRFGIGWVLRHEQAKNHTQIGLAQTKHATPRLHLDARENHDLQTPFPRGIQAALKPSRKTMDNR